MWAREHFRLDIYHSVYTPLVASLNEQLHIRVHEWHSHGDRGTIRQNEVWIMAELFDHTKDIVPSAAIQTSAVVSKFVNDLALSAVLDLDKHERPTSSISKAATMVSISTVPRIVPRGIAT